MEYSDLTEEQKARAKACETPEELMTLAQQEGVELTDEQLEAVAGGSWNSSGGECESYRRRKHGH